MKYLITIVSLFFFLHLQAQTTIDFELENIDNETISFDEVKGDSLTLIDFWTTSCKPCIKAIPKLNEIYAEYKSRGVEIVGVNCDGPRSTAKVGPFVTTHNVEYPVLLDINSKLMKELQITAFPTLLLVNSKGEILWSHKGFLSGSEVEIKKQLDTFLLQL